MEKMTIEQQLAQIQEQQHLILEELRETRRHRQELQELKDDLSHIAKDIFQTAVVELEDVAPFVNTGDFLNLVKKLLRNVRYINNLIQQLESAVDFVKDGKPIGRELFNDLLLFLDELDRKGYFSFIKELVKVVDNVITHFSEEDVRLLGDNAVTILETVRNISQPDMLQSINNAVSIYKNLNIENIENYSMWKALKELNTPELKRGIGFIMTFLKNLSNVEEVTNK